MGGCNSRSNRKAVALEVLDEVTTILSAFQFREGWLEFLPLNFTCCARKGRCFSALNPELLMCEKLELLLGEI